MERFKKILLCFLLVIVMIPTAIIFTGCDTEESSGGNGGNGDGDDNGNNDGDGNDEGGSTPEYPGNLTFEHDFDAEPLPPIQISGFDVEYKFNEAAEGRPAFVSITGLNTRLMGIDEYYNVVIPAEIYYPFDSSPGGAVYPITAIEDDAFSGTNIVELTIHENVTYIGESAFENCASLKTVKWEKANNEVTVGNYAFSNCVNLEKMDIPENVKTLGNRCFNYCKRLTEITIPSTVTHLGMSIFQNTGLKILNLNAQALEDLYWYDHRTMFGECRIETLNVGKHVGDYLRGLLREIDGIDFSGEYIENDYLRMINVDEENPNFVVTYNENQSLNLYGTNSSGQIITDAVFHISYSSDRKIYKDGIYYQLYDRYSDPERITAKVIGSDKAGDLEIAASIYSEFHQRNIPVTEIDDYAFSSSFLSSIIIPEGIISIGEGAFERCPNLVSIELPSTLKKIGLGAFAWGSLKLVKINSNIESGAIGAFDALIIGKNVSSLNEDLIDNLYFAKIIVVDEENTTYEMTTKTSIYNSTIQSYGLYEKATGTLVEELENNVIAIDGVIYEITKEGDAYEAAVIGATTEHVKIPSTLTYEGIDETATVTKILSLENLKALKYLEIPSTVKEISSISGCSQLNRVIINGNETIIHDYVFSECVNLSSLTLNGSFESLGRMLLSSVGIYSQMQHLIINGNINSYQEETFEAGLLWIKNLKIGSDTTFLPENLFAKLENIETIDFSGNLTTPYELPTYYNGTNGTWTNLSYPAGNTTTQLYQHGIYKFVPTF